MHVHACRGGHVCNAHGGPSQGQYMLAYDNGKSATVVRPGLIPSSVHKWSSATDTTYSSASFAAFGTMVFCAQ
jgi:hypothetical protein